MTSYTEWNTSHLLITGREYIEFIHKISISERRWYHHAYLWYYTHAKVILLALAMCVVIYLALVYRGLVSVAASGTRGIKTRRILTGGAEGSTNGESSPAPNPQPSYIGPDFSQAFKPIPATNQSQLPSETDREQRDAKLQEARVKAAVKKAEKGDRFNYMTKGASKRLTAVKDKVKGAPAAVKEKYKSLKEDFKSGKMKAQAKLMTQEAGARIHDEVRQNAGSIYSIIFSAFLLSGIGLYFVPTIAMIGIGILTFYMFSNFLRSVITL